MAKDWPEKLTTEICNALKERRLRLGVSVYQVSQSSGVSQQAIANYEKLNRRPTLDCLFRISLALGLKPSKLIGLAEERVGTPAVGPVVPKRPRKPRKPTG